MRTYSKTKYIQFSFLKGQNHHKKSFFGQKQKPETKPQPMSKALHGALASCAFNTKIYI